jgi:hypothetical protein
VIGSTWTVTVLSMLLAARRGRQLVFGGRGAWGVTREAVDSIIERAKPRTTCDGVGREGGIV